MNSGGVKTEPSSEDWLEEYIEYDALDDEEEGCSDRNKKTLPPSPNQCNDSNRNIRVKEEDRNSPKTAISKQIDNKNIIILPVAKLNNSNVKIIPPSCNRRAEKRKAVEKNIMTRYRKIFPKVISSNNSSTKTNEATISVSGTGISKPPPSQDVGHDPKIKKQDEDIKAKIEPNDSDLNDISDTMLDGRRNWTSKETNLLVNLVYSDLDRVEKLLNGSNSAKHLSCEDAWADIEKELRKINCPFSRKNIRQKYSDLKYKANKLFSIHVKRAKEKGSSLDAIKINLTNDEDINRKLTYICTKTHPMFKNDHKPTDCLKKQEAGLWSVLEAIDQVGKAASVLDEFSEEHGSSGKELNSDARNNFYVALTKYVELQTEEKRWFFEQKKKFVEEYGVISLQDLQ